MIFSAACSGGFAKSLDIEPSFLALKQLVELVYQAREFVWVRFNRGLAGVAARARLNFAT
jgi:hypothetical protein